MRCGVCGSDRLSPLGELSTRAIGRPTLQFRFERSGGLGSRPVFEVQYARACLDCGAVIPFLGDGVRRMLADDAPDPIEDITRRRFDESADEWLEY
jgi:hypothetical protein